MIVKFEKLKNSLTKTREGFLGKLIKVIGKKRRIDKEVLENIEQILIEGDIGFFTSMHIIDSIREKIKSNGEYGLEDIFSIIKGEILEILKDENGPFEEGIEGKPWIILVVGVNGTGKTTTIGKLAYYYKNSEKKVLLAAGDTYRAAAFEQLNIWCNRAEVDIIKAQQGADSAAVVYDSVKAALCRGTEILIIDTAGRMHTKVNLMEELKKVKKVIAKLVPDAPHEILLILDANMGQNAISQAKEFIKATEVTGIVLTKLDGTAKGGVVIPIKLELGIPVKYIGIGEGITDLDIFEPKRFVDALFSF
ncbi:signal recognition particle-docking protein FtsY [candidate division KSB1 bacterium]